jgi:tripartite-type tricarboxylate transporter receptor subunit TctC
MNTKTLAAVGIGAALALGQGAAFAQQKPWPEKSVRVIVPFAPGGGTDILARIMAARLSDEFKQQFIVDNRAGAGGTVGAEAAVKATPDGYAIIMVSSSYATNAALYKLPYDPIAGIAPISPVGKTAELLLVHPSLPVKNVKQLIDLARSNPKALNYGSSGVGGFTHLETELFNQMANVQMTHVPYKGTGLALTDIVAGQIQVLFASAPSSLPFAKQGRLRPIGVASAKRMAVAPDLPAMAEAVPGYSAELWYGMWAPLGTARPIVDRLNQALAKIVQLPDVRDKLAADFGIEATHSSPEDFAKFIAADIQKWIRVVKNGNIKLD